MPNYIYLCRHGETQWNKIKRLQGRLDSDLTNKGKQQAEDLAHVLADKQITLLASSPLKRALDSAKICQRQLNKALEADSVHKVNLLSINDLSERNLGNWQAKLIADIQKEADYSLVFQQVNEASPPQGESGISCAMRIQKALLNLILAHKNHTIAVIFHGEALRCFIHYLGYQNLNNAYDAYNNGCVVALQIMDQAPYFKLVKQAIHTNKELTC